MKRVLLLWSALTLVWSHAAAKLPPQTVDELRASAEEKDQRHDLAGALADYAAAIKLAPKRGDLYKGRGYIFLVNGKPHEAVADYNKAIALDPKDASAYGGRGAAWKDAGNPKKAAADLGKAIQLDPNGSRAYYDRAYVRWLLGDLNGALADLNKLVELAKAGYAYAFRARIRQQMGDLKGAIEDCTRAIEEHPYYDTYEKRGLVRQASGDFAGAIEDFSKAIEDRPAIADIFYKRRSSAKRVAGDLDGAIADMSQVIDQRTSDDEGYLIRGCLYAQAEKWKDAVPDFDQSWRFARAGIHPALLRYVAQARLGEGEKARTDLEAAMERAERDVRREIGSFLLGRLKETALIRTGSERNSQMVQQLRCEAWYYAGIVQLLAGNTGEATSRFRQCVATEEKQLLEYQLAEAELSRIEHPNLAP